MVVIRPVVKQRLAKLIRQPGGLKYEDAILQAERNVREAQSAIQDAMDRVLVKVASAAWAAEPRTLHTWACELVDLAGTQGDEPLKTAAISLCDLADLMLDERAWNETAVAVHLGALTVLRSPTPNADAAGVEALLAGLQGVVDRVRRSPQAG
jgi:hypothetical protein